MRNNAVVRASTPFIHQKKLHTLSAALYWIAVIFLLRAGISSNRHVWLEDFSVLCALNILLPLLCLMILGRNVTPHKNSSRKSVWISSLNVLCTIGVIWFSCTIVHFPLLRMFKTGSNMIKYPFQFMEQIPVAEIGPLTFRCLQIFAIIFLVLCVWISVLCIRDGSILQPLLFLNSAVLTFLFYNMSVMGNMSDIAAFPSTLKNGYGAFGIGIILTVLAFLAYTFQSKRNSE